MEEHRNGIQSPAIVHFMSLEERVDLLSQQLNDPLAIMEGTLGNLEWGNFEDVPSNIQMDQVKLVDIKKIKSCINNNKSNILNESPKTDLQFDSDGQSEGSLFHDEAHHSTSKVHHKFQKQKSIFRCELCSLSFAVRKDLIKHFRDTHKTEDGTYLCDKCNSSFNTYKNISSHIKKRCVIQNNIQDTCEICDKSEKVGPHRMQEKQQQKNYICETCGMRFTFSCLLKDHINLHTGTKPYLCPICGKSFSQRASLKQHSRTHSEVKPHRCPECPQGFFGKGDLKKHIRKHTGERPYICEVCGERFSQSSHLSVHRKSHTGERPFVCDICSRGFIKRSDLLRHYRIHTGQLPYLCTVCGKAFRQSTQCANHIKHHHPSDIVPVHKTSVLNSQGS